MKEDTKFKRLLRCLQLLQAPSGATSNELAVGLEVNQRTAQRYLDELREHGFEIVVVQNDEKILRYRASNPRMAGALLNVEETLALSLMVPLAVSSGLEKAARTGWDKLHYAVTNGREREIRSELPPLLSSQFGWTLEPHIMQTLGAALVEKRRVRLLYQGLAADEPSWRTIEPWQMFFQERWYLRGRDVEKNESRTFRPDRIHDLELLDVRYQIPQQERSEDPHFHKWDLKGEEPTRFVLQVEAPLERWLQENPVHPSQTIENGTVTLEVRDPDALIRWVMGLTGCQLCQPEWAVERLQERARAFFFKSDLKRQNLSSTPID